MAFIACFLYGVSIDADKALSQARAYGGLIPESMVIQGQSPGAATQLSLTVKDSTIRYVIRALARQANLKLVYDNSDAKFGQRISVEISGRDVLQAFNTALEGTGLVARLTSEGETIMVRRDTVDNESKTKTSAQGMIIGKVVDSASGTGLSGATVTLKALGVSTMTAKEGAFRFEGLRPGEAEIIVKLLGYKSRTMAVVVSMERGAMVNVPLVPAPTSLSEVVTTATGKQRRVEVPNDIAVVDVQEVIRTNPVNTVSDLLSTRVPGLYVARTSGEPGADSRIRIRGVSSINASNEPILILDGVRIRSEVNEAGGSSPIDQIDVNSIQTVEVLKGPSAVALYGSEAANGVIVLTSKRGRAGVHRWSANASFGSQVMPGKWPLNYYAWGEDLFGGTGVIQCVVPMQISQDCRYDSTSVYQILNDPGTTIFSRGEENSQSFTFDGGKDAVRYSLTGTLRSTLGVLKLPDDDVKILEDIGKDVPYWQRRPQSNESKSISGSIGIDYSTNTVFTYSPSLTFTKGRSTPLVQALQAASEMPPPVTLYSGDGSVLGTGSGLLVRVARFAQRQVTSQLAARNAVNFRTRAFDYFNINSNIGYEIFSSVQSEILARGDVCPVEAPGKTGIGKCSTNELLDSIGKFSKTKGNSSGFNARISLVGPKYNFGGVGLVPSMGGDFTSNTQESMNISGRDLAVGSSGTANSAGASYVAVWSPSSNSFGTRRSGGLYLEANLNIGDKLWFPLALRTDAGNAIGGSVRPKFPKIGSSYLISDSGFFRDLPVIGNLSELRLRWAIGASGKQPGLASRYRTYNHGQGYGDGIFTTVGRINSIGNSLLRPERSKELEVGLDAEVMESSFGFLSINATFARISTTDLLISSPLPPSLGGLPERITNLGDALNQSFELGVQSLVRIGEFDWVSDLGVTTSRNILKRLNQSMDSHILRPGESSAAGASLTQLTWTRHVAGYPLYGKWAYPLVAYADRDDDGFISPEEVVYGDSAIFIGAPYPKFVLNSAHTFNLFRSYSLTAVVSYENGATQTLGQSKRSDLYNTINNIPSMPIKEQAYGRYSPLSRTASLSTFRLQSMQLTYTFSHISLAHIGIRQGAISLFGNNLGLWSNYTGKDPNVGAVGETLIDNYRLPTPRSYGIKVRVN